MPLTNQAILNKRKKDEEEKKKLASKGARRSESHKETVNTAKQVANKIKTDTEKKTGWSNKNSTYSPQDKGKTLPTKADSSPNKGRGITQSEINKGKTGAKKWHDSINESTRSKTAPANKISKPSAEATTKQSGHQSQSNLNKANAKVNERRMTSEVANEVAWQWSTNPVPKFIGNAVLSIADNTPVGLVHSLVTGNSFRNDVINNAPYGQEFGSGKSAIAGNFAGTALGYGMTSGVAMGTKTAQEAQQAILNGTKLGQTIRNSSIVGKIGQFANKNVEAIAQDRVRDALSNIAIGAPMNFANNYAQGLRGEDLARQMAWDTAADFAFDTVVNGLGDAWHGAKTALKTSDIGKEAVQGTLKDSNWSEYIGNLSNRWKDLDQTAKGSTNSKLAEAASKKADEYADELKKVLKMSEEDFAGYKNSVLNGEPYVPSPKSVEPTPKAQAPERKTQRAKNAPEPKTVHKPEPRHKKILESATDKEDYLNKLANEVNSNATAKTVGNRQKPKGVNTGAEIMNRGNASEELVDEFRKAVAMTDDEFMAYKNGSYEPKPITEPKVQNTTNGLPKQKKATVDVDSAEQKPLPKADETPSANAETKPKAAETKTTETKAKDKGLPKETKNKVAADAVYDSNNVIVEEPKKSKGEELKKEGNFEVVGDTKPVETTNYKPVKLSRVERAKQTWRNFKRDWVNAQAGLERFDKARGKADAGKLDTSNMNPLEARSARSAAKEQAKTQEKAYLVDKAKGQVGYMLNDGLIDRSGRAMKNSNGEKIRSMSQILGDTYKDEATAEAFDTWLMHTHNLDRIKQGSHIFGGANYAEEVEQLTKMYPDLAKSKDDLLLWLNDTDHAILDKAGRRELERQLSKEYSNFDEVKQSLAEYRTAVSKKAIDSIPAEMRTKFEGVQKEMNEYWHNVIDEYLVGSGIISKEHAQWLKETYPNYVPTFHDLPNVGAEAKRSANVIKEAKGSGKSGLLTVPEQYAKQLDRVVTAARKNELYKEIIDGLEDESMRSFGKVQGRGGRIEFKDLDDMFTTLEDMSLKEVASGKNTITAMVNGEKVTASLSDELAKSLDAMDHMMDTNLIIKVGKTITNPMKFTITGANPVFMVSNMLRDLPTLFIQSKHSLPRTALSLAKATKEVLTDGEKYKMYKALGGAESGYYMRGKGFETSLSNKNIGTKMLNLLTMLGEKGEAIPRMAEFISTLEKTGDAYKALRDAAESTVDFSRRGASEFAKGLDAWVLYLNAGIQGLDKFARTVKNHPLRTAARGAGMMGVPFLALSALNSENPHYQDLTERVRQNNYLIPNIAGEKDENGYCKTFVKIPLNREYGTVFATSLYCALKMAKGEEESWDGIAETLKENFLPNSPITDNVLAPLILNIPQNKDFAGRTILPAALKDKDPIDQYDYETSGIARLIATGTNRIPISKVPILKYVQSPKLVDYILDSYTGYWGDVAQTVTTTDSSRIDNYAKDVLWQKTAKQPFRNKFIADPVFSSKPSQKFYELKEQYDKEAAKVKGEGKTSEATAVKKALDDISDNLTISYKAEKEILADKSMSLTEKEKAVKELRSARNDLLKETEGAIEKAKKDYKEAPTFTTLDDDKKEKWSPDLKMDKETWAKTAVDFSEATKKDEDGNGGMTAEEKRFYLLDHGVTTYEQAQSFLGKTASEELWDYAVEQHKQGVTYKELQREAKECPTYYNLSVEQKMKWSKDLGIDKETWGKAYQAKIDEDKKKKDKTGSGLNSEEEMILLKEHGIKTLEQARTIDGNIGKTFMIFDNDSENAWDEMVKAVKNGKTFEDATKEGYASAIKRNQAKEHVSNLGIPEKHQSSATTIMTRYDGKTVKQDVYDYYVRQAFYNNDNNPNPEKRNNTLDTNEIKASIEKADKKFGLTRAQKAYLFANMAPKNYKNPYA